VGKLRGPADRVIGPGRRERIEAVGKALSLVQNSEDTGEFLSVLTNDPVSSKVTLTSRARRLEAVRRPVSGWGFGNLARTAGPRTMSARLERGDGGPLDLRIISIEAPEPAGLDGVLREIEAGQLYELEVTISPPWPNRSYAGHIKLATGVDQQPEMQINISAGIDPRLTAVPATIDVFAGEPSQQSIKLIWSSDSPPGRILSAVTNVPAVSLRVDEQGVPPTLSMALSALEQPARGQHYYVQIETDDPSVPSLRVPIRVRPADSTDSTRTNTNTRLSAEPASITVPPGQSSQHTTSLIWSGDSRPGRILEVTTNVPGGSVALNGEQTARSLSLNLPALMRWEDKMNYCVLVETDDPAVPALRIPIHVR
jgi:hypothetical protein